MNLAWSLRHSRHWSEISRRFVGCSLFLRNYRCAVLRIRGRELSCESSGAGGVYLRTIPVQYAFLTRFSLNSSATRA